MSSSRRDFFKKVLGTGAVVAGLPACAPDIDPAPVLDVPMPGEDGIVALVVQRYPDLSRTGGAVTLRFPGGSGQENLLVVHPSADTYAVLSATCTHVGCPMGFDGTEAVCPCHLSRFATDGKVTHPPATVPLKTYVATYNAGTQVLSISLKAGDETFPAVVNGKLTLTFAQFPDLQNAGGMVSGKPTGYGKTVFIFKLADGTYSAVDSICPHQQCEVGFEASLDELLCPCHASTFTKTGTVTQGPATSDLKTFTVAPGASEVVVTIP
ncbi:MULTISPECIES: Rieske 2Fe-2S domain-containing protein [Corallococcus]|uniref:Rieske 2Fe-2S domain-containing protein n=1 Tax=Corallococcus TaxID=83461 RepID=UPI00117FCB85|nr:MULTISPECIES: Rieske 2Fe-2S domain-containing protein [Corallococcus]NBD12716.1 Rieske 2Fe-2S domain-containing protein [Corallococcus silvisoli]TSC23203.1 Rieske 2Fe-2S domain-containing protein [Corallococcus sp. Z5C101001]